MPPVISQIPDTDTLAGLLLTLTALSGEFPAALVSRLPGTEHYRQKVVKALKRDKLIRTFYRDGLRGLRLTAAAKKLLLTNAAGCVNTSWQKGDIMVINDHIRLFGFGPLNGPNISEFGPRFNDMVRAYDGEYIDLAKKAAGDLGISIRTGVYMYFPGPSFETPAEIRAARVLGADAVGMSTVPEATVAAHCGMRTLGLSLLTNMAAGISGEKLSGEEVNQTAEESSERFSALVRKVIAGM